MTISNHNYSLSTAIIKEEFIIKEINSIGIEVSIYVLMLPPVILLYPKKSLLSIVDMLCALFAQVENGFLFSPYGSSFMSLS